MKQFAEALLPHSAEDAVLFLPNIIVAWCFCPDCRYEEQIYRPLASLPHERLACPRCGTERFYDGTGTLTIAQMQQEIPLEQLGIPPLHILPVRSRVGWQYFELSADAPIVGWS